MSDQQSTPTMNQSRHYKLLVKWQKSQGVASTLCGDIDDVLWDVENFLTGEFSGEDDTDSVVKIVIRQTTMEEDRDGFDAGVPWSRDIVSDDELI